MKNPKSYMLSTKYMFLIILFIFAFGERVLFDFGPNIELITMAMILTSFYLGKKESFWLTFAIIALSDRIIGNSNIFLFTWSGFLIPALLSSVFIQKILKKLVTGYRLPVTVITLSSVALASNLFFYFWTNFGVWFLGNMYPKTVIGLAMSYINALPFLRYQAISTLVFVPAGFLLTESAVYLSHKYHLKEKFDQVLSLKFI